MRTTTASETDDRAAGVPGGPLRNGKEKALESPNDLALPAGPGARARLRDGCRS